jgi:hypothetical protein
VQKSDFWKKMGTNLVLKSQTLRLESSASRLAAD